MGSTGSLFLDSGSDEHLCTPKFADLIPTGPGRSPFKLNDEQQNDLAISGQKTVPMLVGPAGGIHHEVRDNILSLGKLVRKDFSFTLGPCGCSMEKDGRSVPLYLGETGCVWKLMCCNVRRDLDTWRRGQLLRMSPWMTWTSKSLTPRRVPIQLWNRQLKWHRHLHLC